MRCKAMEGWGRMDCFVASAFLAVVSRIFTSCLGALSIPQAGPSSCTERFAQSLMRWVISPMC